MALPIVVGVYKWQFYHDSIRGIMVISKYALMVHIAALLESVDSLYRDDTAVRIA